MLTDQAGQSITALVPVCVVGGGGVDRAGGGRRRHAFPGSIGIDVGAGGVMLA